MQKQKETKWGWPPLMHSVPNVLVRHMVDAFQAGLLRIRQHNVPNGIANLAQSIGDAEPQAVHWVGINLQGHIAERSCWFQPLVELDAVLHPSVVESLQRLIQDHLKDHIARGDLKKAGAPPEGMAPASRIALPHVILSASGDHVVHSDGWFAFRLIVLAIVALNGDEWSGGMATLPCSRVRMTAMSWFLSQELGTLGCQVHMAPKGVEVHGFNGGSGVAQLGTDKFLQSTSACQY